MKPKHLLIGSLAVAGGLLLYRFANAGANLVIQSGMRVHKILFGALELALEPVIQNPTGGSIRFKFPFVKITFGDNLIASTEPVNLDVKIDAYSQVNLRSLLKEKTGKDFNLRIAFGSLLWLTPQLIQLFTGAIEKIDLVVETKTVAFAPGIPIGGLSVTDRQIFELKKPHIGGI